MLDICSGSPVLPVFWIGFVLGVVVGAFVVAACITRRDVRRGVIS